MKKMWSPWRSVYIDSFNEKKKNECIFCDNKIQDFDKDESLLVFVGRNSFVVMNLYPYNNGHLMIVPNRHINDFSLLLPDEKIEIFDLVDISMKAMKESLRPHGFNFGIGKAAGAGIDEHIHFHIVPRWNGDTNFMPVLGEVKIISQELLETRNKLRKSFNELIGNINYGRK